MIVFFLDGHGKFMGKTPEEKLEFEVPTFALEFVIQLTSEGVCRDFDDSCRIAERFSAPFVRIVWTRTASPKELDAYLEFLKDSLPVPD